MKNRFLVFMVAAITTLSMQSCATNYVVSQPATYTKEYKSDAKVATVDSKKIEQDRQKLIDSFIEEKLAAINAAKKTAKTAVTSGNTVYTKLIDNILAEAQTYLGTPYRYGGTTRSGIDCSAFVLSVFGAAAGMTLPRVAAAQSQEGERIAKEDLRKGDLIFFSHAGRGRISHVGIVESVSEDGEVKFIHSATSRGVMISSLNNDRYWGPKFRFAQRIVNPETASNLAMNKAASTATALNN